jgi:uncharacterized protein
MDSPAPPTPMLTADNRFFWEGAKEHKLMILRCDACGTYIHLPRPVCRKCLSFDLSPAEVSGRATLYSYTVTHKVFHPYVADKVPYIVATVELVEQPGLMLLTNIVGLDEADVQIGMALEVSFQPLGPETVLPVFTKLGASV